MTSPAETLRAAAKVLADSLPGDLNAAPRLVMTDAETVSGIAFCADHLLPRDDEHEYSACDNCAVLDCWQEQLADLVFALLLSRAALAAWLDGVAKDLDGHDPDGGCECTESDSYHRAMDFANAIHGRTS